MFRRKLVGALAAALVATGLMSPVASAQSERVVPSEERDAYVAEFQYDADNPPVVDGVGGLTDEEISEIQETIRQAEASGPPQDEIVPGEMWSDKVGVPEGYDKAEADRAEVAIAKEQSQPQARGFQTTAERCRSFWLIPFQVCGEILDRYEALGGQTSWLLLPIEHQSVNPDGQGHRQRFVGGVIYQHPDTGAHAVSPMTMDLWQRHGWEAGWLGYPLGGEVPVQGSNTIDGEVNGWMQRFQGGRVYRTPVLEGFQLASINGLILDRWLELGGPDSQLGFPIADEAVAADGVGRFSIFQHGSIYWHPEHGAWEILGLVGEMWHMRGGTNSEWGYPTGAAEQDLDAPIAISQPFVGERLDARELFENAGTISIADKEISNIVVEYLDFKGQSLVAPMSKKLPSNEETIESNAQLLAASLCSKVDSSAEEFGGISIPASYDYWGCMKKSQSPDPDSFGRHDYCTYSPDQFGPPGRNAEFSGACSRHDICYDNADAQGTGYGPCNSDLYDGIVTICDARYGVWDPRYATCINTGNVYWTAVTITHLGDN